jgi:hypothetical protein
MVRTQKGYAVQRVIDEIAPLRYNIRASFTMEGTAMKEIAANHSKWVRFATFLNQRVIRTSSLKSAMYFALALAAFLLFYFLVLNREVWT